MLIHNHRHRHRIACITIVFGLSFATAVEFSEVRLQAPRDCTDVYLGGNQIEGYNAVVPNENKPDEGVLVYCGVVDGMIPLNNSAPRASPQNCQDLKDNGMSSSGLNVIYPYAANPETPVLVYCDQELMGGGWTVFQRRDNYDTQLDFYRNFNEYGVGFGNPGGEFWIENDILHELTQPSVNELYVDLTSFDGINKDAHYKSFHVGPKVPTADGIPGKPYQLLSISHFNGDAGDSLAYHAGYGFSTYDADNDDWTDDNCAETYHGGWWFNNCHYSGLNGMYYDDGSSHGDGVIWHSFSIGWQSLKRTEMKVRPLKQQ